MAGNDLFDRRTAALTMARCGAAITGGVTISECARRQASNFAPENYVRYRYLSIKRTVVGSHLPGEWVERMAGKTGPKEEGPYDFLVKTTSVIVSSFSGQQQDNG